MELTEHLADNSRTTPVGDFVWLVNFRQLQSYVSFSARLLAAELHADAVSFRGKNSVKIPDFPAKICRKNVTLMFLDNSINTNYIILMLLHKLVIKLLF